MIRSKAKLTIDVVVVVLLDEALRFGEEYGITTFKLKVGRRPLGIDIDFFANPNQAVVAAAAGTVTFAGGGATPPASAALLRMVTARPSAQWVATIWPEAGSRNNSTRAPPRSRA